MLKAHEVIYLFVGINLQITCCFFPQMAGIEEHFNFQKLQTYLLYFG